MKKLTSCALAAASIVAGNSFASGINVQNLRLVRQGQTQGQIEIQVTQGATQEIVATTLSCNQQALEASQQERTRLQLSGQEAQEAQAILQNQARLASEQTIALPVQGETIQSQQNELVIDYQYQSGAELLQARRIIQAPLVIIGTQVSDVLERIEQQARVAAQEICHQ